MSEARVLSDAPWLRSGPAARVLALLNGDGEEARVVGGAVRNALLKIPVGDIDIATTALPDEVDPPRQGGRHQMRADRHRPRHGHAGGRSASVRGHDLARGYRDLWPQGQGRVRPRLGSRRGTARLHHQRAFRRCRRHRARPCRRACRYRSQTRALHRRCQRSASPRIICASCASSACMPPMGRASPTAPDISPASTGARDLSSLSAERVRMEMLKLLVAEGAAVAVQAMADAGLLLPIFGGVAYTGAFAAMIAAERALGLAAERRAPARRARGRRHRGCQTRRGRGFGSPMRKPRRWIRWAIAGGGSPARTRRGRGSCSIGSARTPTATG